MLDFFRKRANSVFIKVLMAFLVFTFALWGVGDMLRNTNIELALQVGDQHIDQFKWQKLYQQQLSVVSEQIGKTPTQEEIKKLGIDKFIVNTAIDRLLYLEEARHMNLLVSDEMAKIEIATMPQFQRDGKFNKDVFATVLRQSGYSEDAFLHMIKEELAIRSLITAVTVNKTMPDSYIDNFLKALSHKRSGTIYELSSNSLVISGQPTDDELNKLYDSNKQSYAIPEKRQIEFLTFGISNIKASTTVTDEELKEVYNSRIGMYALPESRSVSQLLFKDELKAKEAYDMINSGTSFNEVGKKLIGEKANLLLSDNIPENSLDKEINDAIFKAELGKATHPVKTGFGWHIFLVNSIKPKSTKTFDEVKTDLGKNILDEKKFEQLSELAQKIDKEISMGDDLATIAKKHELKVIELLDYNKGALTTNNPISNNNAFMTTAFATEAGATSSVTPYKGQEEFFVLRVKNITPEAYKPKDEVIANLKTFWEKQQRQKLFTEKADEFKNSIKGSTYNKDLAKQLQLQERSFEVSYSTPNSTVATEMFGEIFELKIGQISNPILVAGKYQIASLEKAVSVDTSNMKLERQKVKNQLMRDVPEEMMEQYLGSLREKYKIVINTKLLGIDG